MHYLFSIIVRLGVTTEFEFLDFGNFNVNFDIIYKLF